jgi:hypothetical protein
VMALFGAPIAHEDAPRLRYMLPWGSSEPCAITRAHLSVNVA